MNKKKILAVFAALMMLTSGLVQGAPTPSPSASPSATEKTDKKEDKKDDKKDSKKEDNKDDKESKDKKEEKDENILPEPNCEAAILIDQKSGDILYEKNKSKKMYPASTTKIMTAVLALEEGDLSSPITITKEMLADITNKHSHMGLKVGETLTLEQLLYGMLVYSANDAANAIGVHIAGNLDDFRDMMNDKAHDLKMKGTHYENPHGFHDDNHYTTAEDLATLARYAMKIEKFAEIVKTTTYRIPANDFYTEERVLSTTNHLISRYRNTNYIYKYATGIKTGFTDEAGNCLVSSASKNNIDLICVILKAKELEDNVLHAFADSTDLYEYIFKNYKYHKIAAVNDVISDSAVYEAKDNVRVALAPAEDVEKLIPANVDIDSIVTDIKLNENIKAPIKKGEVMGSVSYILDGKVIATTELIAENNVKHDKLLAVIHFIGKILTSPLFFIPAIIIIALMISSNNKRRKRRRQRRNKLKYTQTRKY